MDLFPSERVVIARHDTADGEIQLQQRLLQDGTSAFEIIANGVFLMASYNQVSERALATHTLHSLSTNQQTEHRVLVGGLGMGFTLQEVLTKQVTHVDVVETSPYLVEWNRSHFVAINQNVLADPRVNLVQDDLYNVLMRASSVTYSAILLDVDNGPSWLAHERNARLYTIDALRRWSTLLLPGSIFAAWSAQREPDFLQRMASVFGRTEEVAINATTKNNQSVEDFIYCGWKTS